MVILFYYGTAEVSGQINMALIIDAKNYIKNKL